MQFCLQKQDFWIVVVLFLQAFAIYRYDLSFKRVYKASSDLKDFLPQSIFFRYACVHTIPFQSLQQEADIDQINNLVLP